MNISVTEIFFDRMILLVHVMTL